MLDPASSSILTPRTPLPPTSSSSSSLHDVTPLTILTGMKHWDGAVSTNSKQQLSEVELPSALTLSIATTRCPSTASSCSPRDCQSGYADLFSPPSSVGPLSPFRLPPSCTANDTSKRATSAVYRALHFHDNWLTQTVPAQEELSRPPASAVLPKAATQRHNRRDKAKRRSRSAQRHPHNQQQHTPNDALHSALPAVAHTVYSAPLAGVVTDWEQLFCGDVAGSDDECEGGGLGERVDISRAFVFSDLY